MNILVATSGHQPDDDRIFYKEICSLLDAGHHVDLATRNCEIFEPDLEHFRHHDLGRLGLFPFNEAISSLTAELSPDLVMIHEPELLVAARQIKRRYAIPVIYDVHEPNREMWDLFSSKGPVTKNIVNWALNRFERMHLKTIDCFMATSETIAFRYRTGTQSAIVLPNYPRLDLAPNGSHDQPKPLIVYQGQVSVERGIAHLIQAFKGVSDDLPEARLEIMGPERLPGTYREIETVLNQYNLTDKVTLHGKLTHAEVLQRLHKAAIGVIPFTDHPFFHNIIPIKLFEYMMCGCAVVASDFAVIRNLGKDAVAYFNPGNVADLESTIIELLTDTPRRTEMIKRGRALIENEYRWDKVAPRLLEVVERYA